MPLKKFIFVTTWLGTNLALIIFSLYTLIQIKNTKEFKALLSQEIDQISNASSPSYAFAAIPPAVKGISIALQTSDARPVIIAQFLENHSSPLTPAQYYGQLLVDIADEFDLDYRLLPAIAMQESNLCKKIPENTFNCLGLGIHSQGTWGFASYEQNFRKAAAILKQNYLDLGLNTPAEIESKYTPLSSGSWSYAVEHFMEILQTANFND